MSTCHVNVQSAYTDTRKTSGQNPKNDQTGTVNNQHTSNSFYKKQHERRPTSLPTPAAPPRDRKAGGLCFCLKSHEQLVTKLGCDTRAETQEPRLKNKEAVPVARCSQRASAGYFCSSNSPSNARSASANVARLSRKRCAAAARASSSAATGCSVLASCCITSAAARTSLAAAA